MHSAAKQSSVIDFFFYTDCEFDRYEKYPNMKFHAISFEEYMTNAETKLGIKLPRQVRKLCDMKPFLACIHEDEIANYKYWGVCDIDLIFGDMQKYISKFISKGVSLFSTHADRISGHFFFVENTPIGRRKCFEIKNWQHYLTDTQNFGIDEGAFAYTFSKLIRYSISVQYKLGLSKDTTTEWLIRRCINKIVAWFLPRNIHFKEYHTSHIGIPTQILNYKYTQQAFWQYTDGKILSADKKLELPYLHFLFFKQDYYNVGLGWNKVSDFYRISQNEEYNNIKINHSGIFFDYN